jgi:hypothetical protein
MTPTIEELSDQLRAAQLELHRSERLATVAHDAAEGMHEASNPLEVLVNLHYLIQHTRHDPEQVLAYLEQAETQAIRLREIHTRILRAYLEAMKEPDKESGPFVM